MVPGMFLLYEKTCACARLKIKMEIARQRVVDLHLPVVFVQCSYSLMSSDTRNLILDPFFVLGGGRWEVERAGDIQ